MSSEQSGYSTSNTYGTSSLLQYLQMYQRSTHIYSIDNPCFQSSPLKLSRREEPPVSHSFKLKKSHFLIVLGVILGHVAAQDSKGMHAPRSIGRFHRHNELGEAPRRARRTRQTPLHTCAAVGACRISPRGGSRAANNSLWGKPRIFPWHVKRCDETLPRDSRRWRGELMSAPGVCLSSHRMAPS